MQIPCYKIVILLVFLVPHVILCMKYSETPGDLVIDERSGQSGIVIEVEQIYHRGATTCREKKLALVPLPGQTVPCPFTLQERTAFPIDKESAQRSCAAYCSNQLLREFYNQLKRGTLVGLFCTAKLV